MQTKVPNEITTYPTSRMSWDTVYSWSQFLVVLFAAFALVSGLVVNKRQARQLLELEISLEKQREKTALAEKSLLELQQLIREPRTIDSDLADQVLDWGEKGAVSIGYVVNNEDAANLANAIGNCLAQHGWNVLGANAAVSAPPVPRGITVTMQGKNDAELDTPDKAPEPLRTLAKFFSVAIKGNPKVVVRIRRESISEGLSVMIGPKF